MGPAARADLAGKIEASGMHEGPGMLGFLPQGIKQYARNGGAAMEAGQAGMSTAEDAITNLPGGQPSVPIRDIVRTQRDASARELGLADPAGEGSSAFRSKIASNLEADARNNPGAARGELPWSRALEQRRNFDSNASWGANPGAESAQNAIRKDVANDMRGAIDTSLNSPNVPPNLAQDWRGARDQYSLGSKVQEPALAALDAQSGRVPTSAAELPSMFARARGNAALSGAERGIASGFDAGAQGSAVAARGAGFVAGQQPENHEQNAAVTSWLGQKGVRVDTVTQQSRGNMLGPAAADLLKTEPQALGQWQGQFAQAANEGPEALNALIIKLESDPQFRAGPLARLQQMTGAQNGQ
jgi:hypothetical protein